MAPKQLGEKPFLDLFKGNLQAGVKTATSRTERWGSPGDRFTAFDMEFELTHVVRLPLGTVANWFHGPEACATAETFVETWELCHQGTKFPAERLVYLHLFRRV